MAKDKSRDEPLRNIIGSKGKTNDAIARKLFKKSDSWFRWGRRRNGDNDGPGPRR